MALCQLNNVSINYERIGNAKSNYKLVFVHGAGCTLIDLMPLASYLSNDFECIVLDLPNHGKSTQAEITTITDFSKIIRQFIATVLPNQNVIVIGYSMGGAIALDLAVHNDLGLKGFVILDSAAYMPVNEAFLAKLKRGKIDMMFMIKNSGTPLNPNVIKFFIRHKDMAKHVKSFYQDFMTTLSFDLRDKLGEIQVPVLAITGEKDLLARMEYVDYLQSHIPNCKEIILPRYGHLLPIAAPQEAADMIRFFITELSVGVRYEYLKKEKEVV